MMALRRTRKTTRIISQLLCASALTVTGCQLGSSARVSSLEAQIRDQDSRILNLTRSLEDARAELGVANLESRALRESFNNLTPPPSTEQVENSFRVTAIEIVQLLSGGLDRDNHPGDELLTLLVAPQDRLGETLRAAGSLSVEVFDFSLDGEQRQLGRWTFTDGELSDLWHNGLIGRGYRLVQRWDTVPSSNEVSVHVRLVTRDGRQFDETSRLTITPPVGDPQAE